MAKVLAAIVPMTGKIQFTTPEESDELWQKVVVLKIRKIPISAETQLSAAAVCVKHITYEWALRFIIKWTQYYFEGVFLI